MGVTLSEGGENHHTEVLQKAAKQIAVVKALTVSNRETFECLRKFCETYKKDKREKAMYKEVIHQASAYVTTINTSISVAKKGMGISRQAADLLDRRDDPKRSVGLMLTMTQEALGDAKTMEAQYRGIRVAEMQRQTAKSLAKGRGSIKAGTKCTDGHLLDETVAVLDQFSLVVGDFVNWWSLLQVDVDRLTASIKYIRNDPEIKSEVKRQWNDMEQQYEVYHKQKDQPQFNKKTLKKAAVLSDNSLTWLNNAKLVDYTRLIFLENGAEHIRFARPGALPFPTLFTIKTSVQLSRHMSVAIAKPETLLAPASIEDISTIQKETSIVARPQELPVAAVNDLTELAAAARQTFQIFEPWSQAESTVDNELLKDIILFIRSQSTAYCRALNMSLDTSRNCIILSDAATSLCFGIQDRLDDKQLAASVDMILNIAKEGATQSEEVVKRFRNVRQGLFQLTSRIPHAVEQIAFEQRVIEKSKKRHSRAHKHVKRVHRAFAGITDNIIPVVAPLVSAAIPGLGIVLPMAFPLATLAAKKATDTLGQMVETRDKQQLACSDAIKRLEAISNDLGQVIDHVGKFTLWWQDIEFTFKDLKERLQSPVALDPMYLRLTRERFAETGRKNRTYISDITRLEDFFPKLVEYDGFHKRVTTSLQQASSGDLAHLLHTSAKTTHRYCTAYHRLQISAGEAKSKHRPDLDNSIEAIRRTLHAECETLHGLLRYILHASQSTFDNKEAQEVRRMLDVLLENAQDTQSTFEGCFGHRHRKDFAQLSHIMHGLVANTENINPIDSLDHSIREQMTTIQELIRYFNHTFSAITYSAIISVEEGVEVEPWKLDRAAVTEVMDKVSVSADSLAKPQMALVVYQ
ncbi:hypothetical protein ONZ45_g5174 [Pleurotus djamor]|nr:hypothetical protein ONZ45_g5174 [Pleurotus djamor]